MIDTHCHLDLPQFDGDRTAVLDRAFAAGVESLLIPAVGPDAWESLLAFPKTDSRLQVGLGIHPAALPELSAAEDGALLQRLDELLPMKGSIAVGECGLDGPSTERAPLQRQLEMLEGHFFLARKHRLPLLVHCLHAHPALVDFLKTHPLPDSGGILHSYSGGPDLVRVYLRAGFHFSFAGPITYPGARKPLESLRAVPLDRLHLETDAPDQAPHPHRGQRNEPSHLPLIASAVTQARGVSHRELALQLRANARALFGNAFFAE